MNAWSLRILVPLCVAALLPMTPFGVAAQLGASAQLATGASPPTPVPVPVQATGPSVKDLAFTVPGGWQERPNIDGARVLYRTPGGDDTYYNFLALAPMAPSSPIDPTVVTTPTAQTAPTAKAAAQGSLQSTFAAVWEAVVAPNFDAGGRPLFPLPHRLGSGLTVVIDGARVKSRKDGAWVHVHLYVVDAGDRVYPFVGVESFGFNGLRSKEAERVAAFFASLRIAGYRPDASAPLFSERAQLMGTWGLSSSSSIDWVGAGGQFVGTRVSFADNSFTLAADGSYRQQLLVMIAGNRRQPGHITGRWTLDNGWLVMTPVTASGDIDAKPTRQRVLTVGRAPSGRTVMVFEGAVSFVDLDRITVPVYERKEGS